MTRLTDDVIGDGAKGDSQSRVPRLPLVVIVGPTAVGKTALSLHLAQVLNGEVVSADSRLFYQGMDVGTAKPSLDERGFVRHHLVDIVAPDKTVGLAEFQERAYRAIEGIHSRQHCPLLVGGTGQYVRAIVEGWQIPRVAPAPELRARLQAEADLRGAVTLHRRLAELDPSAASRIDHRNVRRVIRALEVCIVTGKPISEQQKKVPPPYRVLQVGLTMARDILYVRVDQRVDRMMVSGLLQEVKRLVDDGYGWELPAMSGLGYLQFKPYFEGEADLKDVVAEIKRVTRVLIRRQYNWFRLSDPMIRWFDAACTTTGVIEAEVCQWLATAQEESLSERK